MELYKNDTIAAISTAMTGSGIGIIRISGEKSVSIAEKIFHPGKKGKKLSEQAAYTAHYGMIKDGEEIIDEVLVLLMKKPHSYTAEDTVEIHCHGGVYVMKRILDLVIRNGARPADPGEFTKRAFLNGRIDLSQAEAVMDVIQAKNEYALKNSVSQLKGSVMKKIRALREQVLYEIAYIESALDDPEHISLEGYPQKLCVKVDNFLKESEELLTGAEEGRVLREGIRTVIVGKPNVGKSSLLNVLAGDERAIVTEIAGTTRDALEEQIRIRGLTLNLVDTAGIRETEDVVERIGVDRAKNMVNEADLVLYVVDSSSVLDENDEEIISAFALCDNNAGEAYVEWSEKSAKAMYIDRLGVNVEYSKKGIGQQMLNKAKEISKSIGAEYLRLFVVDINKPAIRLYQKNGFTKVDGVYDEVFDDGYVLREIGYEIKL